MKLTRLIQLSVATLALAAVASCSTTSTKKSSVYGGAGMSANNANLGAQTYAAGSSAAGYQTSSDGLPQNSLQAPSNQTYYFTFNNDNVRSQDLQAMNVQAGYLTTHPSAKIFLGGNTDNRGSREYNVGLGWRRDQSVARYLEQQGVSPKQIQMVSYGKERPAVLGNNEHAWALNRRVNLTYKAY